MLVSKDRYRISKFVEEHDLNHKYFMVMKDIPCCNNDAKVSIITKGTLLCLNTLSIKSFELIHDTNNILDCRLYFHDINVICGTFYVCDVNGRVDYILQPFDMENNLLFLPLEDDMILSNIKPIPQEYVDCLNRDFNFHRKSYIEEVTKCNTSHKKIRSCDILITVLVLFMSIYLGITLNSVCGLSAPLCFMGSLILLLLYLPIICAGLNKSKNSKIEKLSNLEQLYNDNIYKVYNEFYGRCLTMLSYYEEHINTVSSSNVSKSSGYKINLNKT